MSKVLKLTVGDLSTNCYLFISGKESLIIDPADEAIFIEGKIADLNLSPKVIILTHGHFDHLLAALELSLAYQIPIYVNQKDKFLLDRSDTTAEYFTKLKDNLRPIETSDINNKSKISIGNERISVIEIPGHTPGSIAIYVKKQNIVFTGDLIFADGSYGETSHSYSSRDSFRRSLKKILALPSNTLVYPGHGEEFVIQSFRNA